MSTETIARKTRPAHRFAGVWCLAFVALSSPIAAADPPAYPGHQDLSYYLDAVGARQPIRTAGDWEIRAQQVRAACVEVMGPLPDRSKLPPLDVRIDESIAGDGWTRYHLTYMSEADDRVPAHLFVPAGALPHSAPAVLALHQTTGRGKDEPAGLAGLPNLHYGLELARRGYVVLCPDYPSFGEYRYDFSQSAHPSGTIKGVLNHMRGVDLLAAREEVDPARIGAIGHSLGGHNAIFLALFDPRIAATVSSCGWTPFHDYYQGKLAGWASYRYMPRIKNVFGNDPDRVPFDFPELLACLAPRAFFSNSPLDDDNFAVAGVRKGVAAARPIYELLGAPERLQVRYPASLHDFPIDVRQEAYAFLDAALGHHPAAERIGEELPRIPPREADAAIEAFEIAPGFRLELAAAEPEVTSPVALAFDAAARLYVVEMRDYSEQANEHLGRVRLLEDADGDGRYERSTVFVDGLSWPTAVACWNGGVFVGAAPDIWYFRDENGDGVADVKRKVFTGFGRGNVQGLLNSFHWGLDNRIYGATSSAGGTIRPAGDPQAAPVSLSGRDFSFDPRSLDLRAQTGGGQHGMSFDDWGRRFVCSNSDHLQLVMCEDRYLAGNPLVAVPEARVSIAADGPQAAVFRTSPVEPWRLVRTRLRVAGQAPGPIEGGGRAAGYFTSATGVTVYRGNAWPAEWRGQVFVGDVGSNIVHRKRLEPAGAALVGQRIDQGREFVSSSDIWFRPVQFANAPDGTLYIADMYREVIEHPESLPPSIKRHLDLTSGRDRGRIWRIASTATPRPAIEKLAGAEAAQLVAALGSENGWTRDTAARLLYERQDPAATPLLASLASAADRPLARMHALYALSGQQGLTADILSPRLSDEHPRVREHALRLVDLQTSVTAELAAAAARLAGDDDPGVRYQLALTAARLPTALRLQVLESLAKRHGQDPWIEVGVQLSARDCAADLFDRLFPIAASNTPRHQKLLSRLALQIGKNAQPSEVRRAAAAIESLLDAPGPAAASLERPAAAVMGLIAGLRASRTPGAAELLEPGGAAAQTARRIWKLAASTLEDSSPDSSSRAAATRALALAPFDEVRPLLVRLLDGRESPEVQLAAMETLGRFSDPPVADALIEVWPALGPALHAAACDVLFSRESWALAALAAIDDARLPRSQLDPAKLALLAKHSSAKVRRRWTEMAGSAAGTPKDELVAQYRPALEPGGDRQRGRAVFRKHCASCHRVEDEGHAIGPNLAAMRARGAEAILLAVLDPNREVNPQFQAYVVLTSDGRSLTGVLSESATSVTLRRADEATDTILRSEIEQLSATGVSLMPEGLERSIDVPAMADLLAYMMSLQ